MGKERHRWAKEKNRLFWGGKDPRIRHATQLETKSFTLHNILTHLCSCMYTIRLAKIYKG